MKKFSIILLALFMLTLSSCKEGDGIMTFKDGVFTVNTTNLGKDIEGYNGATPLLITIEKKVITSIEVLDNEETPRYLKRAEEGIFKPLIGRTPEELVIDEIDAVAGATYSSEALIANLRLGLQYYVDNKFNKRSYWTSGGGRGGRKSSEKRK